MFMVWNDSSMADSINTGSAIMKDVGVAKEPAPEKAPLGPLYSNKYLYKSLR